MSRFIGAALAVIIAAGLTGSARADEKDTAAILDKAIKALGGEEKLSKIKAATLAGKGTISLMGMDSEITTKTAVQGLDHFRQEFEGDFGGNKVKGVTVLAGDKGWRKFGDMGMEMDKDALANQKRAVYLTMIPVTILPLKGKDYKVAVAGEEKVGDKPAVGIKVTPPDGKEFTLYFDKESGLPAKVVAKVAGFMGEEFTQETTFDGYKEMDGIKKATKLKSTRDGNKFLDVELTEFKVVDKHDAKTFTEPG